MGGRYLFIVYGGGGGGLLMAKIDVDGTVRVSKVMVRNPMWGHLWRRPPSLGKVIVKTLDNG